MADYQLTATDASVIRTEEGARIPDDPANRDWAAYQEWVEDGGVPDAYVPPPEVEPEPTVEQEIAFDHENRILALEGKPPLTFEEFAEARLR